MPSAQQEIIDAVQYRGVNHCTTGDVARPNSVTTKAATMLLLCRDLSLNEATDVRQTIAQQLSNQYSGANATDDIETDVTVKLGNKAYAKFGESAERLGLEIAEVEYVKPDATNKTPRARSKGAPKEPRECLCGCSGMTGGGRFLPGHDAKMKGRLIKLVDQQLDQASADKMVEMNWWSEQQAAERMDRARAAAAGREAQAQAIEEQNAAKEAAAV